MRVIIADDSEILRSRLVEMLSEIEGIKIVAEAKDTKEAIEVIKDHRPDVVIMDIKMPGNDGIKAIETIRKAKGHRPKIIVFTNYPYLQYRKRCLDAGADHFFYKATEFRKLVDVLGELAQVT
jgi:DNA-binding NarL/FixJ family response regulator